MKKKRLEISYNYDFELIGVISSAKGYKLAWELNRCLGIKLVKQRDVSIQFGPGLTGTFTHFAQDSAHNIIRLFKNKPNEAEAGKNLLIQEFPHFDYVLMTQGADKIDSNRLQEYLRDITSVEMVAFIPLDALKAKDYFIF